MNSKLLVEQIFLAGVERVLPDKLIQNILSLKQNKLIIGNLEFLLEDIDNIFVVGAGKASAMMAAEVEKILGNLITVGYIVVKYGHSCKLEHINVKEAGHPIPDANGIEATRNILKIAEKANKNDLVICLISGGGSALLSDIPEGTSLQEMIVLNDLLINCGASIDEINTVRKHLSLVKGGQLARSVKPATLVSLILSDVLGDPLDVIASGPTAPDPSTFGQALKILEKYDIQKSISKLILQYLKEGEKGIRPETPKPGDLDFIKTFNIIIGNNALALEASKRKALELDIDAFIVNNQLKGDITIAAKYIVETSLIFKNDNKVMKPLCLLFGGETTVKMTGTGLGGRNQHLALLCSSLIQDQQGITILTGGTDGSDGPTDAAGAVVDTYTLKNALKENINPNIYLKEFDSYNFFKSTVGLVITGPTMTNVMDIVVVIIE